MRDRLGSIARRLAEAGIERVAARNRRRLARVGSPFLLGIHRPVAEEHTLRDLPVEGEIPLALAGRYLKMGANPVDPALAGQHWFLGDGMVHGIALGDGRAHWYRNRWIGSRSAAAALGRAPAPGPRRGRNDTVNTNVVEIGGRAFALVEAGSFPVELSEDLESQAYNPFDGTLAGSFSGHPHRDPADGTHHAIAYDGDVWDRVRHVVLSPDGRVVRDVAVPVRHGPCIHDMAITARFALVLDLPVTFSMRAVVAGHVFPYRWNPAHPARLGLLPRGGDANQIVWCGLDPCFVFHVANAFDREDGRVVLDAIVYDTMFASSVPGVDAIGRLERWVVDPETRGVERRVLDPRAQEFPRMDERRFGAPYRFLYTVAAPADGDPQLTDATSLFRHDLETGARRTHEFGADRVPGEFVFVPAHADAGEDEGWLLGLVIDRVADTTALEILDAREVERPPVATVRLPHRIPPGFHGNWFPAR